MMNIIYYESPGLLDHKSAHAFLTKICIFGELGWHDIKANILNGVPQLSQIKKFDEIHQK